MKALSQAHVLFLEADFSAYGAFKEVVASQLVDLPLANPAGQAKALAEM